MLAGAVWPRLHPIALLAPLNSFIRLVTSTSTKVQWKDLDIDGCPNCIVAHNYEVVRVGEPSDALKVDASQERICGENCI